MQAKRYNKISRQNFGQPAVLSHLVSKLYNMVSSRNGIVFFNWNFNDYSLENCHALHCLLLQDVFYRALQYSAILNAMLLTKIHCFVSNHVLPS